MFNLLGGVTKAAVGVALLPIDAAIDLATLGGELTDTRAQTPKRLRQIGTALDNALEG